MYCLQYTKSDELLTPPVIKLAAEDVKKFLPDGVKNFLPTHVKNSLPRHVKNSLPCGCKITLPRTFEKAVAKYDKNPTSELLDLSNEVTSETASVYMEIGIQVGVLLMMDMIKNIR